MIGAARLAVRGLIPALVFVLALAPSGGAAAGDTEVRVEVETIIPPLQRLEIEPPILVMPEIQAEDLTAGYAWLPQPVALTVSSNVAWSLWIRSAGDGMEEEAKTRAGGPGRSLSFLEWRSRDGTFRALGSEWAVILAGREPAAAERVELNLRLSLRSEALSPGMHQPRIEYRLAPADE